LDRGPTTARQSTGEPKRHGLEVSQARRLGDPVDPATLLFGRGKSEPETDKQKEHTATPDAADHGERAALEGVTLAGDRHQIGKITAMGSLLTLPSRRFRTDR
jgi:hypothetical protein